MMHHNSHKNVIPAAAGIAAVTLAAGAAAYAMNARSMKSSRKAMKRTAGKAARGMGEMVNTVVDSVASNVLG